MQARNRALVHRRRLDTLGAIAFVGHEGGRKLMVDPAAPGALLVAHHHHLPPPVGRRSVRRRLPMSPKAASHTEHGLTVALERKSIRTVRVGFEGVLCSTRPGASFSRKIAPWPVWPPMRGHAAPSPLGQSSPAKAIDRMATAIEAAGWGSASRAGWRHSAAGRTAAAASNQSTGHARHLHAAAARQMAPRLLIGGGARWAGCRFTPAS